MVYCKRGQIVRVLYLLFAVLYSFVQKLCVRSPQSVVLCYHGVKQSQRDLFERQMTEIARCSISNITANEESCVYTSNTARVFVTFDDGFANLMDNALPVLEHYHVPATIFAVADNFGCRPRWKMPEGHPESNEKTMTVEQLVALSKNSLVRIGSHTLTHPDLTSISSDEIAAELTDSKKKLERLLGCHVEELAFPYGRYNEEVLGMAQDVGYKKVYATEPRLVDPRSNGLAIGRFSVSPDMWRIEFMLTCAGAYAWLYPWRRFVRRVIGNHCSID